MPALLANALTMGEPSGIGAEITLKIWRDQRSDVAPFFIIDNPDRLRHIANTFEIDVTIVEIDDPKRASQEFHDALPVIRLQNDVHATLGEPDAINSKAVLESIERCVEYTLAEQAAAVVTNPIQKETLYKSGFNFPGHTEYLAELVECKPTPVMMLASPMLRVVPITVHMSLRHALDTLTTELIIEHGKIVIDALRNDFGIDTPRLAVAGLNPHAGEAGALGDEDANVVLPAISILQAFGAQVHGPVSPDALFTERARMGYDAALCMYHDQALIPIKALDVDRAVNTTLGLPIIRTSPDHGTAVDIAAQGIARPSSLIASMKMASEIAQHRANRLENIS